MTEQAEKTHQEVLPPDYQDHLDNNLTDKMHLLDERMRELMDEINGKVKKAPF